jgi:hypothetical protein
MKIYYVGGTVDMIDMLYENGFDGNLFLIGNKNLDSFMKIARFIDNKKNFKYMVAIRPYTISPQYLSLMCESINQISPNKIQVNLVSGHIKENEMNVGGIVGPVNDLSSPLEKSKYMINFLETMHNMKLKKPDLYVSCTNEYTYEVAKKYNYKIILPYSNYLKKEYGDEIDLKNVIIAFAPTIKENEEHLDINIDELSKDSGSYTKDSLTLFLDNLKKSGVYGVLIARRHTGNRRPLETENKKIINFVKNYTNSHIPNNAPTKINPSTIIAL